MVMTVITIVSAVVLLLLIFRFCANRHRALESADKVSQQMKQENYSAMEGEDIICPKCNCRNRVGSAYMRTQIYCEKCNATITIAQPSKSKPDFGVVDEWFSAIDRANNR